MVSNPTTVFFISRALYFFQGKSTKDLEIFYVSTFLISILRRTLDSDQWKRMNT